MVLFERNGHMGLCLDMHLTIYCSFVYKSLVTMISSFSDKCKTAYIIQYYLPVVKV